MFYTSFKSYVLALLLFSFYISCDQIDNPCKDKLDYSQTDVNEGIDLDAIFAPPTSSELSAVLAMWDTFDMSSNSSDIIETFVTTKIRKVQVIVQEAENRNHYGGIVLPLNYDSTKTYPLMIWANGLSQDNPMVDLENGYGLGFANLIPGHFVLIPSFRGQSLMTPDGIYCSDGFFGDAYDGATDDALRFMTVALERYDTQVDRSQLSIYGGSRGGTVALLAGIRYPSISKVVSQSGPTQFHHRHCYDRYGWQFQYQFLSKVKPISELRQKMIGCSPLYFIDQYPNELFLVHGRKDSVVPLWNAQNIADLRGKENLNILFTDDGHMVGAAKQVANWIKES